MVNFYTGKSSLLSEAHRFCLEKTNSFEIIIEFWFY